MKKIHLTFISDSMDCETCGMSYAEGFTIDLDGKTLVDHPPSAHCYAETNYPHDEAYAYLSEMLKTYTYQDFPFEYWYENAVGKKDFSDEHYEEEYDVWYAKHQAYPALLRQFFEDHDVEFVTSLEDRSIYYDDDPDWNNE